MNNLRKKAGLQAFAHLQGQSLDEIQTALKASENNYNAKEVDELAAAIYVAADAETDPPQDPPVDPLPGDGSDPLPPPDGSPGHLEPDPPPDTTVSAASLNSNYEEWQVDPITEPVVDEETGRILRHKLVGKSRQYPFGTDRSFDKIKKVKTTSITPERAAMLNEHSQTSRRRYYLVK